jgi:hypothetical protein
MVRVCQLKFGSRVSQYWNHWTVIGNGAGEVTPLVVMVPTRPEKSVPGSSPYHRNGPWGNSAVSPCSGVDVPTSENGLKRQSAGFMISP